MKIASLIVALAATTALLSPAIAAPLGAPGAWAPGTSAIEQVQYLPRSGFPNPLMHDTVVDWCSTWSTNCGPGGATLFCQEHGFARALSWNVITAPKTYVIGDGRYCTADYCKGYSFIRCG